jgi:undecaprenyl-diphosphatase
LSEFTLTLSVLNWITNLDKELLIWLNQFHAGWLDDTMIFFSEKWVWLPLYAFLLGLLIYGYRKQVWKSLLVITLVITAADMLSTACKFAVGRLRPCQLDELQESLYFANDHCGGKFGFFSSHASNAFALAAFMVLLVSKRHPWIHVLWLWAGIVSYSRVYLVVHYPIDIVTGALFGCLVSVVCITISKKVLRLDPLR